MFHNHLILKLLLLFCLAGSIKKANPDQDPDRICGKWMSSEKNLIVQVYKDGASFKARLVWFKNVDNSKRMEDWTDKHNPDASLRSRKLIGMNILRDMDYIPRSNSWENGKIYDANNGREWSASARLNDEGQLKVTGYWHFKFIGRTMTFTKM